MKVDSGAGSAGDEKAPPSGARKMIRATLQMLLAIKATVKGSVFS